MKNYLGFCASPARLLAADRTAQLAYGDPTCARLARHFLPAGRRERTAFFEIPESVKCVKYAQQPPNLFDVPKGYSPAFSPEGGPVP
jgi:hypothetical protein